MTTVERVEASWAALQEALDGLAIERMSEPGVAGDWSVKDLLAHVAYWEGRAIGTIERSLAGEQELSAGDETVDSINEGVYDERSDWSVERALDEFHGTHQRFMAALRQHPGIDPNLIAEDAWEHYDEHTAGIRAWRERVGA